MLPCIWDVWFGNQGYGKVIGSVWPLYPPPHTLSPPRWEEWHLFSDESIQGPREWNKGSGPGWWIGLLGPSKYVHSKYEGHIFHVSIEHAQSALAGPCLLQHPGECNALGSVYRTMQCHGVQGHTGSSVTWWPQTIDYVSTSLEGAC